MQVLSQTLDFYTYSSDTYTIPGLFAQIFSYLLLVLICYCHPSVSYNLPNTVGGHPSSRGKRDAQLPDFLLWFMLQCAMSSHTVQ